MLRPRVEDRDFSEFDYYPTSLEVDMWLDEIWELAESTPCEANLLPEQELRNQLGIFHMKGFQSIRFMPEGMDPFYGYWQPAPSGPSPLLAHLPGYRAEMSSHPDLVAEGYSVLHINPLGYMTPSGADYSKQRNGHWPVLPDTINSDAKNGYKQWLVNCVLALRWAQSQQACLPGRVSFFGTSQGGGCALLLASLYKGKGVRSAAADVPFLTHFPLGVRALDSYAYQIAAETLRALDNQQNGWHSLGFIDTLSHAHRLSLPVLMTACENDKICPPQTVEALNNILPGTRSFCFLKGMSHSYTGEFIRLASAWFRLFA